AQTIDASDFTSAQKRLLDLAMGSQNLTQPESAAVEGRPVTTPRTLTKNYRSDVALRSSQHLAPVELNERNGLPGPDANRDGVRCSNKGFLPMSTTQYLSLLEWTARQRRVAKAGRTPKQIRRLFKLLEISADAWNELVRNFGRLFSLVAGKPAVIDSHRSRAGGHRYRARPAARDLLAKV
ncbi:MAG: hypothetical protein ACK48Y_07310, partial [Planctomyces sp.]